MEHSPRYIVLFAAAVCGVCSIFVSVSNVALRERYERNKTIDVQTKVLTLAGLIEEGEDLSGDEISTRCAASIRASVIDMATGTDVTGIDVREAEWKSRVPTCFATPSPRTV